MTPMVRTDSRNDRPWTRSRPPDYGFGRPAAGEALENPGHRGIDRRRTRRAGRPPFRPSPGWRRILLAGLLAASVTAAGCVIQQRAQGVLPTQPLPPPPSEPGVKAANPAAAQAPPAQPERKPLSVPR
jgi:hypothetical protein